MADAADSDAIGLWYCAVLGLVSPTPQEPAQWQQTVAGRRAVACCIDALGCRLAGPRHGTCCSHQPLVSEYAARYPLRGRFLRQISELPSSDECPNSCSSTSGLPHAAMTLPSEPTTTLAKAYHALNAHSGLLSCAELEHEHDCGHKQTSSRAGTRGVEPRRPSNRDAE